ncbi:MAG: trypsin-like serine peptidase [Alphaproteobacteria bacterium]
MPRWRRLGVGPALLAALLAAGPVAASSDDWPWSGVGRVLRDGKGPCSGVLIDPSVVFTAGHCVAERDPWKAIAADRVSVVLNDARYRVADVRVAPLSPFDPSGQLGPIGNDWALLVLARRAAVEPVPLAGLRGARRAAADGRGVFKVGWRGEARRRDVACTVLELAAGAFTFQCPGGAGAGRSGSALLARADEGYVVLGVQSAEAKSRFTTLGIAVSPEPRN